MTETRAEKAQRLVDEGGVHVFHRIGMYTVATVRGDQKSYTTNVFSSGNFFCTCPWGYVHSYTDDLCAHALAVKLAVKEKPL